MWGVEPPAGRWRTVHQPVRHRRCHPHRHTPVLTTTDRPTERRNRGAASDGGIRRRDHRRACLRPTHRASRPAAAVLWYRRPPKRPAAKPPGQRLSSPARTASSSGRRSGRVGARVSRRHGCWPQRWRAAAGENDLRLHVPRGLEHTRWRPFAGVVEPASSCVGALQADGSPARRCQLRRTASDTEYRAPPLREHGGQRAATARRRRGWRSGVRGILPIFGSLAERAAGGRRPPVGAAHFIGYPASRMYGATSANRFLVIPRLMAWLPAVRTFFGTGRGPVPVPREALVVVRVAGW